MSAAVFFEFEKFRIRGRKISEPDWYEIDASLNGKDFPAIGQAQGIEFCGRLKKAFLNKEGTPIKQIAEAKFTDLVGDPEAQYLGYAEVSGYDTFYVFRKADHSLVVVLADKEGSAKAHASIDAEVAKKIAQQ